MIEGKRLTLSLSIRMSAFAKAAAKQVKLQTYTFLKKSSQLMLAFMLLSGCQGTSPSSPPPPDRVPVPTAKEQTPVHTFGIIYPMAHPFYEMITDSPNARQSHLAFNCL